MAEACCGMHNIMTNFSGVQIKMQKPVATHLARAGKYKQVSLNKPHPSFTSSIKHWTTGSKLIQEGCPGSLSRQWETLSTRRLEKLEAQWGKMNKVERTSIITVRSPSHIPPPHTHTRKDRKGKHNTETESIIVWTRVPGI